MTLSFRSKLLASHVALVVVVGLIALFTLDRWLQADLIRQLDQRLEEQGKGALEWSEGGKRHPDRITQRIAHIVDAEVTLFDKDGTVLGASTPEARTDSGPEVTAAQAGTVGKAARWRNGQEFHYVAVPGPEAILRLAQPLSEINALVASTRRRLLFASTLAILAALLLGVLASRVASRPLQDMTATATRLARGEFDAPIPTGANDEFGVLWRALKSLAEQLKERIGQLVDEGERLQRLMTVRRDFVANVSHELRTPVTSIQGYAETLQQKKDLPAETRIQFVDIIHRQAARMGALVEQLLALSELEARGRDDLAREPVNVLATARHVSSAAASHRRDVKIDVDVPEALTVLADPDGVERALQNLVDNAVKYGGNVRLTAKEEPPTKVTIVVADDGDGIEPQHLPRLFERFYRVDTGRSRQSGGAGLGLAIVKHLVESMDGSIRVESEVGKGTRFFVTLPAPRASQVVRATP